MERSPTLVVVPSAQYLAPADELLEGKEVRTIVRGRR